ncbi:histidinol-phosphate transaminase [Zavarzinia compransoris]|uniref:histidinol-phosphate transaminase n=1 Tax=Zavarzinia marina TaxID=2911065 RepID=UPI001F3D872F|nr:histidinol-phosphate transaminase [Zavarzinia marina]MCF4166737.1 histidinol-phosphate transaminase [Zavarzinia marina]
MPPVSTPPVSSPPGGARPVPRPGILAIAPYVGGRSTAEPGQRVIKLSSNESGIGPSPRAIEAYRAAAEAMHRYPDGGAAELRAAIAESFDIPADRIVCGAGSDELIHLLTTAYAAPGDEVLYSEHGFLVYPISAHAAGATPVKAPEKDLRADVDALLAAVTPATKLVYLANPNNPTGTYLPPAEVARLHAGLPGHVLLVLDAAYAEFVDVADYEAGLALVEGAENVVMLRTFSKLYGLAALRLGWAYCPEAVADVLNRVRGPFNTSIAAQAAGVASLRDTAFLEHARSHNAEWRAWLTARLTQMGLEVTPSVTNFLLVRFPDEAGRTAADADAWLTARGILLRRVTAYGLPAHLRISIGTAEECEIAAAAIADFLRGEA